MTDADRFEELYRRHAGAVHAYARRRAPADVAEDVTAETFLVAWRRLDRVPVEALPWLYAVARKTLANRRRRDLRARLPLPVPLPSFDVELPSDPALARAFAALSERDREVLALVAWEGLALADVARVLGCSVVSCRVRLHRARQRLARLLAEHEPAVHSIAPHPRGASR
jgi:RNA polymerase sigma-70 factor (ECF subfamily)